MKMPLCDVCSNIDIRSLLAAAHDRHQGSNDYGHLEEISEDIIPYKHHKLVSKVGENAGKCDFCSMIWQNLTSSIEATDPEYKLDGDEGNQGVFLYVLQNGFGQDDIMKSSFRLYVLIGAGRYSQVYHMFQSLSTGTTK